MKTYRKSMVNVIETIILAKVENMSNAVTRLPAE